MSADRAWEQSERFYELLEKMKATHDAKRHDYANTDDVFANFRTCEMAGIPAASQVLKLANTSSVFA